MKLGVAVDVDEPSSWPSSVRDWVRRWSDQCRGASQFTLDLPIPLESECELRRLLMGFRVRMYHCTRLLPHEVEMIRKQGLVRLTPQLVSNRIDAARSVGAISLNDAKSLDAAHAFALGQHCYRENQVCLILSKRVFRNEPDACETLLTTWGGEAIYMGLRDQALRKRLTAIGTPSIVVADVDLEKSDQRHLFFPDLHKVFVGADLGLADAHADVFYKASVQPERIRAILQPASPEYMELGPLPIG